jgi:hypothetical protein
MVGHARGAATKAVPAQAATAAAALMIVCVLTLAGCGTTKVSGTARTANEQLLLTNAWDDALRQVDFRPLAGVPVYFDPQYLVSPVDQGWMISSIRQAMLAQGVLLRPKAEVAQWVVEARVGTYGTNDSNWLFGIPQMTVPSFPGVTTGAAIPEVPLAKRQNQQGVVKVALYAYDRATGQVTWTSGTALSTSSAKDVYIGGLGPIQSGTIRSGTEFVGVRLPTISDPGPSGVTAPLPPAGDVPYHAPNLNIPSSAADRDAFAP